MAINLGDMRRYRGSNWESLLNAIAAAGKYVELDLSACTIGGDSPTRFDTGDNSFSTGRDRIVALILPNTATRRVGASGFSTFSNLRTVSGQGMTIVSGFFGCTNLESVSFPQATEIGNYAFSGSARAWRA